MYYSGYVVFVLFGVCMAINVSVQYNGGLLPDRILFIDAMLHYHRGTRLNAKRGLVFAVHDLT